MQTVYRFKLRPNSQQREKILSWQPMLRSFYNFCLRDRIESYYQSHKGGNYCDLSSKAEATPLSCSVNRSASIGYPWKEDNPALRRATKAEFNPKRDAYQMQSNNITYLRAERPWYQEIPYDVLQQSLRHLNRAFNNFYAGKAKFPRFKRLCDANSFEFKPKSVTIQGNRISLPLLGTIKFFKSRVIENNWTIKTVTLTVEADGFYVSILLLDETIPSIPLKTPEEIKTVIACDVGIKKLVALSDKTLIPNPQFLKVNERRLTIRQKRLSRKKKGSKNRNKAGKKVAKVHQKIKRQREDYQWKTGKLIASKGDLIGFEDLKIQNMKARCRPLLDKETGRYLRNGQEAKSKLNKAISDAAWYSLRIKTIHQAAKLGNRVITVNARQSSQTCSKCGYVSPKNRDKEKFICECCSYYDDADLNAALVLLKRTIDTFFNQGKSEKSSVKSKKILTQKTTKKSKSSSLSKEKKLPKVIRKVTPKPEVTGSNYREKSVSLEVEPGNLEPVKYVRSRNCRRTAINLSDRPVNVI